MAKLAMAAIIAAFSILGNASAGEGEGGVYAPMTVFAELAGRTWRGEGVGPNGQAIVDIARYEMILGGRAFQSTHRLEGGDYGGRTIFFYDAGEKEHIFHYFTTSGFHTIGVIEPTETGFNAVETISGHPEFAEVHSQIVMDGDRMRVDTFHIDQEGKQSAGDALDYVEIEDPGPLYEGAEE